jgi:hypothetical protein
MEERFDDIPRPSHEENVLLIADFSEKEVLQDISMKLNKAPRPHGFPAVFYQKNWEVVKGDLMALFGQLEKGELPLYKLIFAVITLLPRKRKFGSKLQIQQYRPICHLNVSFKIFTKVATNRITYWSQKMIRPTQTVFMPG